MEVNAMPDEKIDAILVGLCGRSGSGKGYVSELFAEIGIPSVDTDAVYREMTSPSETLSPCMKELAERFGNEVISPDGSLNRSVMRGLVFSGDADALADLNKITHKHILEKTMQIAAELAENGAEIVLIDAPLLFESGFDSFCVCSICVTAPEEKVLKRIMRRDGISEEDAKKRLAVQKPVSELRARADFEIANDSEREVILERVKAVAESITEKYRNQIK